jgi:hypothetical protein
MFAIRTGAADQKKPAHTVTSKVRPIASEQWPLTVRAFGSLAIQSFATQCSSLGGTQTGAHVWRNSVKNA